MRAVSHGMHGAVVCRRPSLDCIMSSKHEARGKETELGGAVRAVERSSEWLGVDVTRIRLARGLYEDDGVDRLRPANHGEASRNPFGFVGDLAAVGAVDQDARVGVHLGCSAWSKI